MFDIQKRHINHKGEFVITAGLSNNGVLGQSDIKAKVFESHSITIDMFGCAFYRSFPYKMVTHARVFSLKPKFEINHKIGLFLSTLFFDYPKKFGYENMCSWAKIKNDKVILPLKPTANTQTLDDIDFNFMEKFIAELEQCRLAELEAYLKATGLSNTTLSNDEENALNAFNGKNSGGNTPCGLTWQSFKLGDLFEKVSARFLGNGDKFKATSKSITDTHNIPLVYCKKGNNGIMYWGKKGDFETYNNIISIIYNGVIATGLTYAHRDEVGILAESYFIKFKNGNPNFLCNLFIKTAIEKVLYPKYSRDNLATWANKVENELIFLPTNQHGKIDFHFMHTFINALMKQTIQGVVQYSSAKIQATKEAISQETPTQKDSLF
ncbi:restriction endonuclease subunit S [Helicobacter pylori]|uniref:restriction endonuclease subunit S n=1 Tax=Helicobacter pylori TaxID=210 RepID=UPI0019394275|nr:restriction endonuclease subunit S [Helicobacter pylori]MBM2624157.1 restriction endonuclease subunit S [Helicobacter pylori]